jgi:hypothetical protein
MKSTGYHVTFLGILPPQCSCLIYCSLYIPFVIPFSVSSLLHYSLLLHAPLGQYVHYMDWKNNTIEVAQATVDNHLILTGSPK